LFFFFCVPQQALSLFRVVKSKQRRGKEKKQPKRRKIIATTMNATEPLPRGQQMLLQRLIAKHCVPSNKAEKEFNTLVANWKDYAGKNDDDDDDEEEEEEEQDQNQNQGKVNFMGPGIDTLEDAFVSINRQLKPGFGLEIVTLVDTFHNNTHYIAVINTMADEIAKKETVFAKSWNAHERAFVRLVMRALVDQAENDDDDDDDDDDNDDNDDDDNDKKSRPSIRRADLINLRSDLEGGFKLTLDHATRVVGILLEEKWLRTSLAGDSDEKKHRRESVQAKIELAPRTFLELSHYITSLGFDERKLPQFLFHRRD
jgi:hypothetical protein